MLPVLYQLVLCSYYDIHISFLCYSNKKPAFELIKLGKKQQFDLISFGEKLKANNNEYAKPIFLDEDPRELYIAINEFMFHISPQSKNTREACYWIEWFIEFSLILCGSNHLAKV